MENVKTKEFTFVLSEQEANQVLTALGNLPYIQSFQLINKLQAQATSQSLQANQKPVENKKE